MRIFLRTAIAALLVLIVPEAFAHFTLESEIIAAVHQRDPSAQAVSAVVGIPVVWGFLVHGSVPRVTVSARHVNLSVLTADRVTADARGVHLDVVTSIIDRRADVTRIDRLSLTVAVTEAEASAALPHGWAFSFADGTATLHTPLGAVTGRFGVPAAGRVAFALASPPIPGLPLVPSISFPVQPLASCVSGVRVSPGTLTISCVQTDVTSGFLPHV